MADNFDFNAVFKFAVQGAKAAGADVKQLVDRIEDLRSAGLLGDKAADKLSASVIKAGNAADKAGKQFGSGVGNINSARYALQDASNTAAIAGAALLGFGAAAFKVAIDFESDFAQVARTSGETGQSLADLRKGFVDLASSMPTSFADLADIGSLGAQLNIAGDDLTNFTATVARLTTASDLTTEAAGTAIARIAQLTGVGSEQYENLGSAIALVGVKSIATESQIVKTANNIASIGNFAGFSAAEIVGLAGTLASLGIPPELSRGTLERLFTQIGKASTAGGEDLENFARVAGVSAQEFASAFSQNSPPGKSAEVFTKLIKGLGAEGDNARKTLADLGIKSVRDVPALLKLAQSSDVLTESFRNANKGFEEGTELQRQYNIIAETTASQLQNLGNNFSLLLDSIGSQGTGVLKDFIGDLNDLLISLREFSTSKVTFDNLGPLGGLIELFSGGNAVGGDILVVGAAIGVLVGVLALLFAGAARATAGVLALRTAYTQLGFGAATASTAVGASNRTIALTGVIAESSALGVDKMGLALSGLATALSGLIAIQIGADISSKINDTLGITKTLKQSIDTLTSGDIGRDIGSGASNFFTELDRSLANATGGVVAFGSTTPLIKQVDDELAGLVQGGNITGAAEQFNRLAEYTKANGGSIDELKARFPEYTSALESVKGQVEASTGATEANTDANAAAAEGQDPLQAALQESEDAFKKTYDALKQYNDALFNSADAQSGFYQAIDDGSQAVTDAGIAALEASGQYKDLDGNIIASAESIAAAGKAALTAAGEFDITTQSGRDADAQLRALAEAGNGAAAELFNTGETADVVSAKLDENEAAVRALGERYGLTGGALDTFVAKYVASPKDLNYNLALSGLGSSQTAIDNFLRFNSGRTIPMYIQVSETKVQRVAQGRGGSGGLTYAEGGYTGRGGKYEPAGTVHKGEYVVPKKYVNQSTGLPNADAFGKLIRGSMPSSGYASGGYVGGGSGVMELGPKSLQRLSGNVVNVLLDSGLLTQSVNNNNARTAQRGGGR
jgi:TP901 family phage tail tape measure protein